MNPRSHCGRYNFNTCSSGSVDQEVLALGGEGRLLKVRVQRLGPNGIAKDAADRTKAGWFEVLRLWLKKGPLVSDLLRHLGPQLNISSTVGRVEPVHALKEQCKASGLMPP